MRRRLIATHITYHKKAEEGDIQANPLPLTMSEVISKLEPSDYIQAFDYHFTRKLSEYACSQLRFVGGFSQYISYDQMRELLNSTEEELPIDASYGDLHYLINKLRAEHSLTTFKTNSEILKFALECLKNPNHIEGEVFLQWLEHMYRLKKDILWDKYMEP